MISKETFVGTMASLHNLDKKMSAVDEAFRELNRDFCGFFVPQVFDIVIELLEEAMNDNEEWINYFAFECNWLDNLHHGDIVINGECPDIKTWEDVYDFIVKMNYEE